MAESSKRPIPENDALWRRNLELRVARLERHIAVFDPVDEFPDDPSLGQPCMRIDMVPVGVYVFTGDGSDGGWSRLN